MTDSEHDQQALLINWYRLQYPTHLIFAVPNMGKRDYALAAYLKAEGLTAGIPDIVIPMPRKTYHGLFIELKKPGGRKPSDNQQYWLEALTAQGYLATVCYGFEPAKNVIREYFDNNR